MTSPATKTKSWHHLAMLSTLLAPISVEGPVIGTDGVLGIAYSPVDPDVCRIAIPKFRQQANMHGAHHSKSAGPEQVDRQLCASPSAK
jgi:hypothetical protein